MTLIMYIADLLVTTTVLLYAAIIGHLESTNNHKAFPPSAYSLKGRIMVVMAHFNHIYSSNKSCEMICKTEKNGLVGPCIWHCNESV